MVNGNTFDVKTIGPFGHATKVWREIRHRYPAGGNISNVADFVSVGKISAGLPVKYDKSAKTIKVYSEEAIINALSASDIAGASATAFSSTKTYKVGDVVTNDSKTYICKSAVTTAGAFKSANWKEANGSGISTLGINAYLQEDAFITDANTIATGTAIYGGEIYEYMFGSAVAAALQTLTTVPQIVWVL